MPLGQDADPTQVVGGDTAAQHSPYRILQQIPGIGKIVADNDRLGVQSHNEIHEPQSHVLRHLAESLRGLRIARADLRDDPFRLQFVAARELGTVAVDAGECEVGSITVPSIPNCRRSICARPQI